MAQAEFLVNELKIIDQGDHVIVEGCKRCVDGRVVDHVVLMLPGHLRHVLREFAARVCGEDAEDKHCAWEQHPGVDPPYHNN